MDNQQFDLAKFISLIDVIDSDIDQLYKHNEFLQFCRETTKIFMQMGGILKKAFEDINDKCRIIERNYNMHKNTHDGLVNFIILEKQQGLWSNYILDIAKHNGENNDHLKDTDQEFYYKYESTSRTMLRLMWFFDFVYFMIDGLLKDKQKHFSSICQSAYNQALGTHHPFHIRMAVKAGLLTVGDRKYLFEILFKEKQDEYATLEYINARMNKLRTRLWDLFKQHQLCELP